jgi:hypothetical protein
MMTGVVLTINAVGCEEEEGEKGYVNQAKGGRITMDGEHLMIHGWS